MKGKLKIVILATLTFLLVGSVSSYPLGAETADVIESSRFNQTIPPTQIDAQAGNVTELSLTGIAVTRFWQGFYGNITGTIILSDATGNNFYDWGITNPTGQVYASRNDSVSWSDVACPTPVEIEEEETFLGQLETDPDSITNTFSESNHPEFLVGTQLLENCPTTQAFSSGGTQDENFWQILLSSEGEMIYTTLIEDTTPEGFDGRPWHFQLLVGENGVQNTNPTPYYFYLELQ